MTRSSETLAIPIKTQKNHDFQTMVKENQEFMVFIGFSHVFLTKSSETLEKPKKAMKNHDQELRNIGTANKNQKNHDFQTMVKENQEFMVFIGFSNVFLTKSSETLEKPVNTMNS